MSSMIDSLNAATTADTTTNASSEYDKALQGLFSIANMMRTTLLKDSASTPVDIVAATTTDISGKITNIEDYAKTLTPGSEDHSYFERISKALQELAGV